MAGLYIHIPYCHSKCAYCDFYSTPSVNSMEQYVEALLCEIRLRINEILDTINTVYIGGGTPSVLSLKGLERVLDCLTSYLDEEDYEFTKMALEKYPTIQTVTLEYGPIVKYELTEPCVELTADSINPAVKIEVIEQLTRLNEIMKEYRN